MVLPLEWRLFIYWLNKLKETNMKIVTKSEHTIITIGKNSIDDFFTKFSASFIEFTNQHLIIDISENINTKIEDLLLFLKLSASHKANGTSFVIVCKGIDIDDIPEELSVVPTFIEALDMLEMDAIERDLGF